jgi:hypothetical protein
MTMTTGLEARLKCAQTSTAVSALAAPFIDVSYDERDYELPSILIDRRLVSAAAKLAQMKKSTTMLATSGRSK